MENERVVGPVELLTGIIMTHPGIYRQGVPGLATALRALSESTGTPLEEIRAYAQPFVT